MKKTTICLQVILFITFIQLISGGSTIQAQSGILIQAEDYVDYFDKTSGNTGGHYRNDDVDIWWYHPNHYYVGSNSTGEWLEYDIDVPFIGNYRLDLRVATPNSARRVYVEFDGFDETGTLTVPNTGGWTSWKIFSADVQLLPGRQVMRLVFDYGGLNIDWISLIYIDDENVEAPNIFPSGGTFYKSIEVVLSTPTLDTTIFYTVDGSDPKISNTRIPYYNPFVLYESTTVRAFATKYGKSDSNVATVEFYKIEKPDLTIQAEDYDKGGQGIGYYDKTPGNTGGKYRSDDVDIWSIYPNTFYVGSNSSDEWLNYTIDIPFDGLYRIDIRVATPNVDRQLHVDFDGINETGSLIVPNTGGWTSWQTLSTNVQLTEGRQTMRLAIDYGGFNIDQISLVYLGKVWCGDYNIYTSEDVAKLSGYALLIGDLKIIEAAINNFNGLHQLSAVEGNVIIRGNKWLTDFSGLNYLKSVTGLLRISNNTQLNNLEGLNSLQFVGELQIWENSITSLKGLDSLTEVSGDFSIVEGNIINFEGLSRLESVGDLSIIMCWKLLNFQGLDSLSSINGVLRIELTNYLQSLWGLNKLRSVNGLFLNENQMLFSLNGLNNLSFIDMGFIIVDGNPMLNDLGSLQNLTHVNDNFIIKNNARLSSIGMNRLRKIGGDFNICGNPVLPQSLVEELRDQILIQDGIGGTVNVGPDCN